MSISRAFRKTSIKDVARQAGVSTTTVSYFVSGRENVCAPETAKRIRAAIEELHYTPSTLTRGLRQQAMQTIGVGLYSPLDPLVRYGNRFFERLWSGIVRECGTADYALLHYPPSAWESGGARAFLDGRVDGLLLQQAEGAAEAARAGMPLVLLARAFDLPAGSGAVHADETQTVGLALDHLLRLGHRRIAHLAGPVGESPGDGETRQTPVADDVAILRRDAYIARMRAEGLYDPALIGHAFSWFDRDRAAEAVRAWRALADPPTAILCANDLLAAAVVDAAHALGWRVPEMLSVVGVDDSDDARAAAVPLTSIAVPVDEIGSIGVRTLIRLMKGESAESCRVAVPVTDIIVRGSTAAVPAAEMRRINR
ncbi:MAG TPA: LacI family DNA-binding transcriptional regulator [Armatimonadaceae bacterium]|nr:LacI family DNA-binding transcriptional regulator [Armatimonadaceae bacterium]